MRQTKEEKERQEDPEREKSKKAESGNQRIAEILIKINMN